MEKINTPLMQSIERKKDRVSELKLWKSQLEMNFPEPIYTIKSITSKIDELGDQIKLDESLLPTERDVIEKAHLDGQKRSHSPSKEISEIYFNQTFKSYE